MKKVIISLLLMVSTAVSAEPGVVLSAGVFGMSNASENNRAINYSLPSFGVILSADTNKHFGFDMMISDQGVSADVKASLDISSFKFSAGVGVQRTYSSVTNNDDMWDETTVSSLDQAKMKFIEVVHDSGIFLRYSELNYKDEVNFIRTHNDFNLLQKVVDNQKTVNINEKINSYMLGYKVAF